MPETVIRVENLGKKYIIGHQKQEPYTALRDVLANSAKSLVRKLSRSNDGGSNQVSEEFWALRDVSFEIKQGDRVGIIGRNGAGKSTLLKILSRITEPTNGSVRIKGRVASLLEVGTGFHPELSGRENIFLNGSILGMSRVEIKSKFDEIVAFAEVEKFLDTPVKRYSSGMYVRLAFAVAAHLEPEILVVDEVLAVGDAEFQKKCLGKMKDVSDIEGRTVLFVSHNMGAIRALSSRAIYIDRGGVLVDGGVDEAVNRYVGNQSTSTAVFTWEKNDPLNTGEFAFRRASVLNRRGEPVSFVAHDEPFSLSIEYEMRSSIKGIRVGFLLQNNEGVDICGSNDVYAERSEGLGPTRYVSRCDFPSYLLNHGNYHLQFGAHAPYERVNLLTPFCLSFSVEDTEKHGESRHHLPGVLRPKLDWSVESV